MNDVATTESTALAILNLDPKQYAAAVYEPFAAGLQAFVAECAKPLPEATTVAGMKACVERRAMGRTLRVAVEKARQERKAPVLEIGRLLDARAKEIAAQIAPGEDAADAEIKRAEAIKEAQRKAAEEAERARIAGLQAKIAAISRIVETAVGGSAEQVDAAWHRVDQIAVSVETFGEFAGQAQIAKDAAMARLHDLHDKAVAYEAEQARLKAEREALAKERAEAAAKARQEAAERAKAEAEAKAARDAEEAAARAKRAVEEAELKRQRDALAAERAEFDRKRREAEAEAEAEKVRREQEAAAQAEADRKFREDEKRKAVEAKRIAEEKAAQARKEAEIRVNTRPSDERLIDIVQSYAYPHEDIKPSRETVAGWLNDFNAGSLAKAA